MISRSTLAFFMTVTMMCPASPAFAQSRDAFGPVLPMVFDGQGGRHYCLYGYHGPFDPPIAPKSDYTTVVCPREPSPRQLRGTREKQVRKSEPKTNAVK